MPHRKMNRRGASKAEFHRFTVLLILQLAWKRWPGNLTKFRMTDSPIEKFKRKKKKKFCMAVRDKAEASQAVEASLGFSESADERGGSWSSLEPPCHRRGNQTKRCQPDNQPKKMPTSLSPTCHAKQPKKDANLPTNSSAHGSYTWSHPNTTKSIVGHKWSWMLFTQ